MEVMNVMDADARCAKAIRNGDFVDLGKDILDYPCAFMRVGALNNFYMLFITAIQRMHSETHFVKESYVLLVQPFFYDGV